MSKTKIAAARQKYCDEQLAKSEEFLSRARAHALRTGNITTLIESNQKLWEFHPRVYQRLIGPIYERHRAENLSCYCNAPKSGYEIFGEIMSKAISFEVLNCDDCWEVDILTTWMDYKHMIPPEYWKRLCELREIRDLFPE